MKTKKEVMTDPLLRKGHRHIEKDPEPKLCYVCGGMGIVAYDEETGEETVCGHCQGLGEVYE